MRQETRRAGYLAALCYYAGALWPLIPGARNFFGPHVAILTALTLWAVACALLASPWPLVWSPNRRQSWWRAAVALALGVVPPLGLIGWASPLTAAGLLFPGTAWWGLAACTLAPGLLAVWPRSVTFAIAAAAALCNLACSPIHKQPPGWIAIDTHFGGISHGASSVTAEYEAVQAVQQAALAANAKVILFPETVAPTWTAATDAFWQPTLDRMRSDGKTLLVGARFPVTGGRVVSISIDDSTAAIAVLGGRGTPRNSARRPDLAFRYDNALIIRGAEVAVFRQRIPVPVAMWRPFILGGARLHLFGPGTIGIGGERAAVLICYEQLLVFPVVTSLWEAPTVIIGTANDHWAAGTPIPLYQRVALGAWARLFGLAHLSATNE
jgi:predicted amidohydrolase